MWKETFETNEIEQLRNYLRGLSHGPERPRLPRSIRRNGPKSSFVSAHDPNPDLGPWQGGRRRAYLPGAIQNLRAGKLTTTASRVLTTEAMVPASVASMPRLCWQKLMT